MSGLSDTKVGPAEEGREGGTRQTGEQGRRNRSVLEITSN